MTQNKYSYIYGPVSSWRLGASLGIGPVSTKEKTCTFDCVYCQAGKTQVFDIERKVFIPTEKVINEIKSLPPSKIDYITFSGRSEPTLAKNLGEMIAGIKKIRKEKIAVITNSSLIDRYDVREDLKLADFVMVKLDASTKGLFLKINKPAEAIEFDKALKGIKEFRSSYKGRLALQIMFIDENKDYAKDLAMLAKKISPDEVQINTPLRPCKKKPLSREELDNIKKYFKNINVISVYDIRKKEVKSFSKEDTLKRRGKV